MREIIAIVNGVEQDPAAPAVGPLDPGLLGHGVYESIRTYGGVPFAVADHLDRLRDGATALAIACPYAELARDVARAAALREGDGETRIRANLTAGGVRIVVADALPDRRRDRDEGLAVSILPWARDPAAPTAGVKASSTAASRVAQRHCADHGTATGVWVTPAGHVSEAIAANVFVVVDGELVTPPLSDGALAGVPRGKLLALARDAGIATAERSFTVAQLAAADEAILSATSEPVVPLVQVDGVVIADGRRGPVTRRLQSLFDERARALTRPA